jgi:acid-sensing ion channel, other
LKFPGSTELQNITDEYPLKAIARQGQGLKLFLTKNEDLNFYDTCGPPSFMVHSPYELPGSFDATERFQFDFGFDYQVQITPGIIRTDENLRDLEPKHRGCYFEGERKLEFFKAYTRRNCEFECFSKTMLNFPTLNCSQYFVVRDQSTEVCDYRREWRNRDHSFLALRDMAKCNCLDECNSIKYKVEVIAQSLVNGSEASIEFKFKDIDVVPLRRSLSITFSEFLAQSGGMLELFAGISVLSIFELFYFLTVRWLVNLWR